MNDWRLCLTPHKCNFTIFSRSKKHTKMIDKSLNLTINGQKISFEKNPKFLGIMFDGYLNGSEHIEEIKEKTKNRLNILRILSFKKRWMIKENVLINIYKSLIRSIIDYSAFLVSFASDSQLEKLERIQNEALRIILRLKRTDHLSNSKLRKLTKIESIKERMTKLSNKYIRRAVINSNDLINELLKSYQEEKTASGTYLCKFYKKGKYANNNNISQQQQKHLTLINDTIATKYFKNYMC